jgi:hypothetical protein
MYQSGFVTAFVCLLLSAPLTGQPRLYESDDAIVIETSHARYDVGKNGLQRSLVFSRTGINYLNPDDPPEFMRAYRDGQAYVSSSVQLKGDVLHVAFGDANITATIRVEPRDEWFILNVSEVEGAVDSLRIVNLGLTIREGFGAIMNACYNDDAAVSVQALTPHVNAFPQDRHDVPLFAFDYIEKAKQYVGEPQNSRILTAQIYVSVGFQGARVAVLTCPGGDLPAVTGQLELAEDLPHPMLDGVWGKQSPRNRESYIYAHFGMDGLEEMIAWAKRGGIRTVVNDPFRTGGHYLVDRERFPNGMADVKAMVRRIHDAGLRAGLHTISAGIDYDDPYVTPTPHPEIAKDYTFTLAAAINADDGEIPIRENPDALPTAVTWHHIHTTGLHLQIDDEIIRFENYRAEPPYAFIPVERGALGTRAAAHRAGAPVHHLAEQFRHFVPNADAPLMTEVSQRLADIVNDCGFDWFYFDGAEILGMQGRPFYTVTRFMWDLFNRFERDVQIQSSKVDNLTMHIVSRLTSNDFSRYAVRRFLDVQRIDNLKLYNDSFIPGELGWYGISIFHTRHFSTTPDEVEYGLAKAIGWDQPISIQAYQKEHLDRNGRWSEMLDMAANYQQLLNERYFPEKIRAQLREPGQDFKLMQDQSGDWYFRQIQYGPSHQVADGNEQTAIPWIYDNPWADQPLRVRIRAMSVPASWEDPKNITLLDAASADAMAFTTGGDLTGSLTPIPAMQIQGHSSLRVDAQNQARRRSDWGQFQRHLSPAMDLSNHPMIGFWVHGDGSGALLNVHLGDTSVRQVDHYVDVDFSGWRYVSFQRPEGDRIANYRWPYTWKHSMVGIDHSQTDEISILLTDLAPSRETRCYISPVKALSVQRSTLTNPSLIVNGERVTFPGTLPTDGYLELDGNGQCVFYDANGNELQRVAPTGGIPALQSGRNIIEFNAASNGTPNGALITIIVTGDRVR